MNYLRILPTLIFSWLKNAYYSYFSPFYNIELTKAFAYTNYGGEIINKDCQSFLRKHIYDTSKAFIKIHLTDLFKHPDKCSLFALIVEYKFGSKSFIQVFYSDCTSHDEIYIPIKLNRLAAHNCFKHRIEKAYAWISPNRYEDITALTKKMAGPKGDFFTSYKTGYEVYVKHILNKHRNFSGLMLVDNNNIHYFYELDPEERIKWPSDSLEHLVWIQNLIV